MRDLLVMSSNVRMYVFLFIVHVHTYVAIPNNSSRLTVV